MKTRNKIKKNVNRNRNKNKTATNGQLTKTEMTVHKTNEN